MENTWNLEQFFFHHHYRGLISSEGDDIDLFMAFLEALAGGKDKIDNLRIPLQVALLISPIFLLQDAQMHISTFYAQRYKIILVCDY